MLEENADPNIIDEGLGETALHYACLTYNRDVCELLVGAKGKSGLAVSCKLANFAFFGKILQIVGGLVLGCIKTKFCKYQSK